MSKLLLLAMLMMGINEAKQERYECAISLLTRCEASVSPSTYSEYWFYRAIAYHQLMNKEKTLFALAKLEDSFEPLPARYRALVFGMKNEVQNWTEDGLDDIGRLMHNVSRRLTQGEAESETQRQQKEIIDKLDRLIKKQENEALKASGSGGKPQGEGDKVPSLAPGIQPSSPAPDSGIMGGNGLGKVDSRKLREYTDAWGGLPPDKRAKVVEEMTRELPPKYRQMIENYFRSLSKLGEK